MAATAIVAVVVAMVVALGVVLWSWQQQRRAKEVALRLNEVALKFAGALAETATPTIEQRRLLESSLAMMPMVNVEDHSDEALAARRGESGLRELLGDLLLRHEDWAAVRENRARVLDLQRQLTLAGAGDVQAEARAIIKLGDLDRERQPEVARMAYEAAHRRLTEAASQPTASLSVRDDLGWSWERLAHMSLLQGRTDEADRLSRQRVELAERLLVDHPDAMRQHGLAQALLVRAQCLQSLGPATMLPLQERACRAADAALAVEPERRSFLALYWRAHGHYVETRLALNVTDDLYLELDPVRRAMARLVDAEPSNAALHSWACSFHDLAARCAQAVNRRDLVVVELQAAFDHAVACMKLRHSSVDARALAIGVAVRARDWSPAVDGSRELWQERLQSLLVDAVQFPDVSVSELVALVECYRARGGKEAVGDLVQVHHLATRASRVAGPTDSAVVLRDLERLLVQLGLETELADLKRRLVLK